MGDPSGSRWPAVARQQQKRIEGTGRWRMPKPPGSAVGAALREARGACPCFLFPLLKRSCRVSVRCGEVLQDAALRNRLLWGCSCGQLLVSVVPALRRGVEPAPYVARGSCDRPVLSRPPSPGGGSSAGAGDAAPSSVPSVPGGGCRPVGRGCGCSGRCPPMFGRSEQPDVLLKVVVVRVRDPQAVPRPQDGCWWNKVKDSFSE
ncbi:uncharacterized protein LOC135575376 isoform X1 [Columba livia]|uniref:uncharacterized protein LOC135575376 isoform X1 n=1 Tax=Columba livia TaxID=8932 RepID=UPI0031BA8B8A